MRNGWKVKSSQRFSDCLVSRDPGCGGSGSSAGSVFYPANNKRTRSVKKKKKKKGLAFERKTPGEHSSQQLHPTTQAQEWKEGFRLCPSSNGGFTILTMAAIFSACTFFFLSNNTFNKNSTVRFRSLSRSYLRGEEKKKVTHLRRRWVMCLCPTAVSLQVCLQRLQHPHTACTVRDFLPRATKGRLPARAFS